MWNLCMTDNPEQTGLAPLRTRQPEPRNFWNKEHRHFLNSICHPVVDDVIWSSLFVCFLLATTKSPLRKGDERVQEGHYSVFAFCWWMESTSSSHTTPPPLSPPPAGMSPCRPTLLLNTNQIWAEFSFSCFNFPPSLSPPSHFILFLSLCACVFVSKSADLYACGLLFFLKLLLHKWKLFHKVCGNYTHTHTHTGLKVLFFRRAAALKAPFRPHYVNVTALTT